MKKIVLIVGGVVIAVGIVAGAIIAMHATNKPAKQANSANTTSTSTSSYKVTTACAAFSLSDAKVVLGNDAKAGSANGIGDASSGDIAVSTCSYSSATSGRTVTVLARAAKTAAGAASNVGVFGPNKPTGKQDVSGIGDKAFWDAQLSQLDVLQGNNWYIIGNMAGTHTDSGALATSQAVYDRIKSRL